MAIGLGSHTIGLESDFTDVPRDKENFAATLEQLGSAGALRLKHDETKMGICWDALMDDAAADPD